MNTIIIRLLGPEDASLILNAPDELFDHRPDPDQTRDFLASSDHKIAAALAGRQMVAFASGQKMLHPDKPPAFIINEVGTLETWQRNGLATRVCEVLIEEARTMGCKGIWVATEAVNRPARALYRKLGARETKAIVIYDWDGAMDG